VYALSDTGLVYLWDMRANHRFKQEIYERRDFEDIAVGKGFLVLQRAYIIPEHSKLILNTEAENCNCLQSINFEIQLASSIGPVDLDKPPYQLRLGLLVSRVGSSNDVIESSSQEIFKAIESQDQSVIKVDQRLFIVNLNSRTGELKKLGIEYVGLKKGRLSLNLTFDKPG
jgi:hypothetical protein